MKGEFFAYSLYIMYTLNQRENRLFFMMNIPSDDSAKLATAARICSCTATRSLRSEDITFMGGNWASEASPTLGCSIEISRDIYNTRKMVPIC